MNTLLLLLLSLQSPQGLPHLQPGQPLKGEVTDHSPPVETPTLKKSYADAPVVGETYTLQVPESGPWHLDLRSYFFDAYLVLRESEGGLLAEDDDGLIGTQSRIVADLEVGRECRVTVCALHGGRGGFELTLSSGKPVPLSPREKAEADLADARDRVKATETARGAESLETALALNVLAIFLQRQGRYREAEDLDKRALAIREKIQGPEHPDVATILNNLALLYKDQDRYEEAEPLLKRALAIRKRVLGPGNPAEMAAILNNLALLYKDQGRSEEAEPLLKRALAIREKALGPEHSDVATILSNLAVLYDDQGRYEEAEPLYKRAMAIREKVQGPEHPDVATTLNNLASLYLVQGRYEEAEPLYKRALAIWEKGLR